LAPASYTVEWWEQDLAHAGGDLQALSDDPRVSLARPSVTMAIELATEYDCPLHPEYTYLWHDLSVSALDSLADELTTGHWERADGTELARYSSDASLVLEPSETVSDALETLLVAHPQEPDRVVVPDALALVHSAGLTAALERTWTLEDLSAAARDWAAEAAPPGANAVRAVCEIAPFSIRERAPTRIGARMGRPEKSEKRELSPAVHTLFPIGEAGGSQRDVAAAADWMADRNAKAGEIEVQLARRACTECGDHTFRARCPGCNGVTRPRYVCRSCEIPVAPDAAGRAVCPRCDGEADATERRSLDLKSEYRTALENVGEREAAFDVLKGVKGLTSAEKVPEPLERGILRA
jgi:DNA polymerase II large subunit